MRWDDLLGVRYRANGRSKGGMDCYGVVLECARRAGHPLPEIDYTGGLATGELDRARLELGMEEVPAAERREGDIMQSTYGGSLHSGYLVSRDTVLHATFTGVRTSPITAFTGARFFRGKDW